MPRQNREEFLAEIASAKVEGFQACSELVGRLADAGLSLKVAKYALGEAEGELIDQREAAHEVAAKTRVPAEKPKKRRARALADTPTADPLPDRDATPEEAARDRALMDDPAPGTLIT